MKTLRLVRHAKSSWQDASLDDFDRPLKPKGIRRVTKLAKILGPLLHVQLLTSPARRAFDTAQIIHTICMPNTPVLTLDKLYTFEPNELFSAMTRLELHCSDICVVTHNPAITAVANLLGAPDLDNVVTSGYVEFSANIQSWAQLSAKNTHYIRHLFLD
ncbi:SixA phosphatase family protein [Pseudoalteromonas luteoviolacea]|uniref:Phosphohistidine phosphatase SixA n=1 Tax=Pseudoalteromonas luteoviolacea (strain 2ta16) TaxID=1353533 RepID=V4JAQ2_PSEL2|nr:histidine phosphatase family protein [Pseudoalteromonas luteoviolacea]ESP92252.1 phosphohistidine phosphatase SixA [Pseudoalteromonas luteoviolacea 2ta16]KZN29361.1 hypothetical protein N483_07955 [Pseudoalteromonas luteoviolacea NCIMB 1944]